MYSFCNLFFFPDTIQESFQCDVIEICVAAEEDVPL